MDKATAPAASNAINFPSGVCRHLLVGGYLARAGMVGAQTKGDAGRRGGRVQDNLARPSLGPWARGQACGWGGVGVRMEKAVGEALVITLLFSIYT